MLKKTLTWLLEALVLYVFFFFFVFDEKFEWKGLVQVIALVVLADITTRWVYRRMK